MLSVLRTAVFRVRSLLTPLAKSPWSGTMFHQGREVAIA